MSIHSQNFQISKTACPYLFTISLCAIYTLNTPYIYIKVALQSEKLMNKEWVATLRWSGKDFQT